MNCELAKKLKDSGFPFKDEGFCNHANEKECAWSISLSELIAACGVFPNQFSLYGREADRWEASVIYVMIFSAPMTPPLTAYGKTPEEAAANLWLALNEKK